MAHVSENWLQYKVTALNNWLSNHHKLHHLYKKKQQARDYYVGKICEMEDRNLKTIEI